MPRQKGKYAGMTAEERWVAMEADGKIKDGKLSKWITKDKFIKVFNENQAKLKKYKDAGGKADYLHKQGIETVSKYANFAGIMDTAKSIKMKGFNDAEKDAFVKVFDPYFEAFLNKLKKTPRGMRVDVFKEVFVLKNSVDLKRADRERTKILVKRDKLREKQAELEKELKAV